MIKFIYKNAKNASLEYKFFAFYYKYYLCISYKKDANLYSTSKKVNELTKKFRNLIAAYRHSFQYI